MSGKNTLDHLWGTPIVDVRQTASLRVVEQPTWMFDGEAGVHITLGVPEISTKDLNVSPSPRVRSPGIEQVAHDLVLLRTREKRVSRRSSQKQIREQLILVLDAKLHNPPLGGNPKGLVETLADLLLESLGIECPTTKGGRHEQQDYT